MAEMDSLSFKVEYDIGDSKKNIDGLKNSLSGLSKVLKEFEGLNGVSEKFKSLSSANSSISKAASAFSKLSNVKVSKAIGDNLRNITSALDSIDKSKIESASDLADALLKFNQVKVPGLPSETKAKGQESEETGNDRENDKPGENLADSDTNTQGIDRAKEAFQRLKDVIAANTTSFGQLYNSAIKAGIAIYGIGKKFVASKIDAFGKKIDVVKSKITELTRAFGRIALYRALRSIVKSITDGFSEGVTNVYYYSEAIEGKLANSLNMIATSTGYLKNSIGAMAAPLINAIAPAIDYLIDKFVALLNIINQVFARLTGASMWTKAIKQTKKWGETAAGGAGSAKKAAEDYKRTILGFDEINKLNDTKDRSGGSGGGGGGTDYGSMFEEVAIDSKIKDFVDQVKAAFNAGDWKGVGSLLGNKFNEVVDSVDWNKWGSKLGYGVNAGIQMIYFTLKTMNFKTLGEHIGNFFTSAIDGVEWEYLGRFLVRKTTAVFDFFIGAFLGINWGSVTKAFSDGISGAIKEWTDWIQSYDWGDFAQNVLVGMKSAIDGIQWVEIISSLSQLLNAGALAVIDIANGVASSWVNVQVKFYSWLFDKAKDIFGKIKDVTVEKWNALKSKVTEITSNLVTSVQNKWNDIKTGTVNIWNSIKDAVTSKINAAKDIVSNVVNTVRNTVGGVWNSIQATTSSVWNGIRNAMTHPIETAKNTIKGIVDTIKGFFSNFHVSLPHISLPHFSITPYGWSVGDLLKGSIPKLGIQWYAKGGIMDGITPFAFNGNNLAVGGEAGKEAILPLESNTQWMDKVADKVVAKSTNGADYQTLIEQNRTLISLMRRQNELTQEVASKDTNVSISTSDITSGMKRKSRRDGKPVQVGG